MDARKLLYGYKFFRSTLTERENKIYDQLYKEITNRKSEVSLAGVSLEQGKKIINAILADNPMFFYVDSFSFSAALLSCVIRPVYRMAELQYRASIPQLEAAVYAYANQAQACSGSSMETIRKLHNLIVRKMRYHDDGVASHTVIGPLVNRQGVCEGIAKSVKLICDRLRIPSAVIFGTALPQAQGTRENHAWNAIKIDGTWLYFDFTYDLTLNASNPCPSLIRYDYFALSFDEISVDHSSDLSTLPQEKRSGSFFHLHNLVVQNQQELNRLIAKTVRGSSKDAAFKVSKAWRDFSPETALQKALSLKTVITSGFSISYSYSYNDMQRVCYVHFD